MHRPIFALVIIGLLAIGCRGGSNTSTTEVGGEEPPPVVDKGNQNSATTDPGKIADPTLDLTTERDEVRKMTMPELIKSLGKEKLAPAATDELAVRGSQSIAPLIEALDSDNAAIKQRAIFTLGRLGDEAKAALPKLKAIAEDGDDEVQSDAAKFAIDAIEGK